MRRAHVAAEATMNVHTREIAKELSFEDISVHSPGLFRNGDAMRALKANPDVPTFRRALAELNQTQDSFRKILEGAAEKALGNGEADLERIKTNIKRLKFGTIELGTERAFLRSILESRPVPSAPPTETEEFKARNAELKQLKDANDAKERRVEELVRAVGGAAEEFAAEHARLAKRVEALEALEREAEAAELNAGEANAKIAPDPEDEKLSTEDARAALDALDAQARMVGAALRSRDREAAAMKASLEPGEAELASAEAELKIIAGLGRTAAREAAATAHIAETRAVIAEQKTLIERLTGVSIVTSDPTAGSLVLRLVTRVGEAPHPRWSRSTATKDLRPPLSRARRDPHAHRHLPSGHDRGEGRDTRARGSSDGRHRPDGARGWRGGGEPAEAGGRVEGSHRGDAREVRGAGRAREDVVRGLERVVVADPGRFIRRRGRSGGGG